MRSLSNKILKTCELDRRVLTIDSLRSSARRSMGTESSPPVVRPGDALEEARLEAEAIVEAAREEARRIVAEAEVAAAEAIESARQEGYREGYEAGIAAADDATRDRVRAIAAIADNVTVDKTELVRECEAEIVALVMDVARKVLDREVQTDRRIVAKMVERAMARVTGQMVLRIRVNPDDYDLVRQHWAEALGDESLAEVMADKRVKPGGCVIDTEGGAVDAQIDTQLNEIRRAFEAENELT